MSINHKVLWDEVEEAAALIFNIWTYGEDLKWAKEAWEHFENAGLTEAFNIVEHTQVYLRLVTLGRIYHEFCGVAWDEDPDRPVDDLTYMLDINPIALGILAGANNNAEEFDNGNSEYYLREQAIFSAIKPLRREIFDCLKNAYGSDVGLYTRMWKTHLNSIEDFVEDYCDEFEINEHNCNALEYVMSGFFRQY